MKMAKLLWKIDTCGFSINILELRENPEQFNLMNYRTAYHLLYYDGGWSRTATQSDESGQYTTFWQTFINNLHNFWRDPEQCNLMNQGIIYHVLLAMTVIRSDYNKMNQDSIPLLFSCWWIHDCWGFLPLFIPVDRGKVYDPPYLHCWRNELPPEDKLGYQTDLVPSCTPLSLDQIPI